MNDVRTTYYDDVVLRTTMTDEDDVRTTTYVQTYDDVRTCDDVRTYHNDDLRRATTTTYGDVR